MFLGLLGLVLIDVPIAVSLAVVGTVAMVATTGPDILPNLALVMFDGTTKFPLLAIPLFILAGAIMNTSGISRRLIAFASALLGFIRGGLAMVNIGASMFFAEISGSAVADVAALGSILIPAMKRRGYPAPFAAAVTSSSATLAVIIPPSIPMILYAVMADSSVVQLFVAGIIPGVLGGFGLMLVSYWFARRYDYPVETTFRLDRLWTTFKEAHLKTAAIEGGVQSAVVMLLVAASALVGVYLTEQQVPQRVALAIAGLTDNRYVVLALLNVAFLVLGLFLHSAAAIILVVPIVIPLVHQVGIDPVHFGLVVTLNLGIGQQTPPVASVLITACSVAKADIWEVSKVNIYFIGVLFAVLMLVTYVPAIPMSLVELFYG
jgi:TRAP-type C4-dicarboxylate transport system permease large subunit